jgi:hypothetical protein
MYKAHMYKAHMYKAHMYIDEDHTYIHFEGMTKKPRRGGIPVAHDVSRGNK